MHGREPHTHARNAPHRACYSIGDVVELEIEKDVAAGVTHPLDDVRTRGREQLIPHLVEPALLIECLNERHCTLGIREIERYDRNCCHDGHSRTPVSSLIDLTE